jgi:hypothetical protein
MKMGMIVREQVAYAMQDMANQRFEVDLIEGVVAVEREFQIFNRSNNHPLELIADLTGIFPGNHSDIPRWHRWFQYLRQVKCSSDPSFTMHDKLREVIFENITAGGANLPMRFYWSRQDDPNRQDITLHDGSPPQPMVPTATYRIVAITSISTDAARRQAAAKAKARQKTRRRTK